MGKEFVGHAIVSMVTILIFLGNFSHSGLWHPDAPSHALNGVFYKDMIEEGGVLHPIRYAERYYVQYPTLTVGMYPPVFYTFEALFFKVLGVSPLTARSTVLLFSLLGINVFFRFCRLWFPLWLCVVGCILYLLQPIMLFGQRNVMLELPALVVSVTALYCLYVAGERSDHWAAFYAPFLTALAFLTKQNAVFLSAIWLVWIVGGRKWSLVKSPRFLSGLLVGSIILVPWVAVNVTVGRAYLTAFALQEYHVWSNLLYYIRHSPEVISYPVIVLLVVSVFLFAKLKELGSYRFALLWSCCVLLYLSLMRYTEPRYAMFLVPAVVVLVMQAVWFFVQKFSYFVQRKSIYAGLMVLLIGLNVSPGRVWGGYDIVGFDQAADFVLKDAACMAVLYDGYFDENFVFHMRAKDKGRRVFVFRASKVVFSTKMIVELGYNELIKDASEFYDILGRYSIKYVVQEEKDVMNTPANRRLREWVRGPKFRLVQRYPICSRGLRGFGGLLVYEYLDCPTKPIREVELDMPMLGRKIRVNLEEDFFRRQDSD